ncbi:MAG TPA: wax ester/triacylglycerol synthase family O-acyltransferase [Blastocatellia bacterium]|nr:wax ester/triacylglycerol synthase family O-acyltransferase [Blastocatellia bacterium]
MSQPELNRRLSSMDASFLYFEKKETPMHIGSVSLFDGEIPFEDFVAMLDAKMHLLPRYQQVVVPDPFNLGHPTWEHDHNFNIRNHIFKLQIDAPGGEKELIDLAGRIFTPMMERHKPLWDIYLVYGLEGGKTAMICRVHHCMVDGMSGVDLLKIVLDFSPSPALIPPKPAAKVREPQPDPTRRLFDSILGGMQEGMNRWMEFQNGLLNLTQALTEQTSREAMKNISGEIPKILRPAERLPFNGPLSGEKRMVWNTFSFAEARAIRGALSGTVNDVVLTALSGAVSRYVESHSQSAAGRNVRFMVPVSLRQEDQHGALGNLVSLLPVEIPLDLKDPIARFRYVNQKTMAMKSGRVAEGLNLFSALMGILPAPMQALMGALSTANIPVPPAVNMISTNVPGPQVPLYAMGHRMTAYYPYVPVGYAVGCGCAIMSYDQHLYFGLTADLKAMPDVERMRDHLYESFYELRKAAGVEEIKPQPVKAKAAKGKRG